MHAPIDIVVPVFNAADDVARCIESILRHASAPYRLVVIDDASTDPAIAQWLAALEARALPQVIVLRNAANEGFTATANRGMDAGAQSRADVLLLNSDTLVTAGFLDALARCADSDSRIGTVTPFSNNAEICSHPRFCADNGWTPGADAEPIRAALAEAAVPTYPDLPTGVGFCLYLRRAMLEAIGTFDLAYGRGYGEENDLCLRAAAAGFRNVLADDAYVVHLGARSFEGEKASLSPRNTAILLERHPHYLDMVRAYISADPLRALRDAAISREWTANGPAHGVLHVIHGHGGGTEHHARALVDATRNEWRHTLAIAIDDRWRIEETGGDGVRRVFDLRREPGESWVAFVGGIVATFRIGLVHLHNISMCRAGVLEALPALRVPYGYTVHDLNFACPTITFHRPDGTYCGGETDPEVCRACLDAQPAFAHIDIEAWRATHRKFVEGASFLIAPSAFAAAMFARYFPAPAAKVIAHAAPAVAGEDPAMPSAARETHAANTLARVRAGRELPDDGVPTIAVLGAVGPDKGARRVERMVDLVRQHGYRARFVLIGYMDVEHGPWQSDDAVFTIHGRYAARDLPALLAHYRVLLVAFPSAGPETFSFTLSETFAAGYPAVVPPIGALAERLKGTGAGWMWTDEEWRDEEKMLARILAIVDSASESMRAAAGVAARGMRATTMGTMAARTTDCYRSAFARHPDGVAAPHPAFSARRLRDALGYVPWIAPTLPTPALAQDAPSTVEMIAVTPSAAMPAGATILASPAPREAADTVSAVRQAAARSAAPLPAASECACESATLPPTRVAAIALRFRRTKPGRLLARMLPATLRRSLRAILR